MIDYKCFNQLQDMKRFNIITLAAILVIAALSSCGDGDSKSDPQDNDPKENPSENVDNQGNGDNTPADLPFVYGADAGWLTEMESKGIKFYDNDGNETECFALLKSIGFNAARFRVWVQPTNKNGYGPWCDKADVVARILYGSSSAPRATTAHPTDAMPMSRPRM